MCRGGAPRWRGQQRELAVRERHNAGEDVSRRPCTGLVFRRDNRRVARQPKTLNAVAELNQRAAVGADLQIEDLLHRLRKRDRKYCTKSEARSEEHTSELQSLRHLV